MTHIASASWKPTMNLCSLSLRTFLFLGLWHTGRRSLASAPQLQNQPKKIGTPPFESPPLPSAVMHVLLSGWYLIHIFLFYLSVVLIYLLCCCSFEAVVGGGIGGTAAAYYLRQEFGVGVTIDVFEPGTVGGRLATVKIGDHEYETGGSVIHPLNLHMKHFIEKLGRNQLCEMDSGMEMDSTAVSETRWCFFN